MPDDSTMLFAMVAVLLQLAWPIILVVAIVLVMRWFRLRGPDGFGLSDPFAGQVRMMQRLIAEAQRLQQMSGQEPGGRMLEFSPLPPAVQVKFQAAAQRAVHEMRAMDDVRRANAETRMAGIMSDAGAAGIDVSSWNYRS